ncbi:MAG: hypothetical protein E7541_00600 [Ruminococcaceae bacterium]|nr:hypothetical protein [Oscillospiraceae bacterium]
MDIEIIVIIALALAVAATVLAFVFIVPEKKRARLNGFGKFLHDTLNFKYLIVEKILQALYIFSTAAVILAGFFMLFYVDHDYWMGGEGLLLMILGPISVRLAYEMIIMAILLVKNVIQINNKLKNENNDTGAQDVFGAPTVEGFQGFRPAPVAVPTAAPVVEPTPVVAPTAEAPRSFCTRCGAVLNADGTCPNCQ